MIDWNLLAENLSARFNLDLSVSNAKGKQGLLRVEGIEAPNGFGIEINIGWRSVDAIFRPDTFAAALLKTISVSSPDQRDEFSMLSKAFVSHGIRVQVKLNGSVIEANTLPATDLEKFDIQCTFLSDRTDDHNVALEAGSSCLALVLALLPLENIDGEHSGETGGFAEGAQTRVEVTKYERNPSNRAAAIIIHGTKCKACQFDFEEKYGSMGNGFIEIHHKIPVSLMGENYIVDPVQDLIPLCSNCHRMVHKNNPPFSLEELVSRFKS